MATSAEAPDKKLLPGKVDEIAFTLGKQQILYFFMQQSGISCCMSQYVENMLKFNSKLVAASNTWSSLVGLIAVSGSE